MKHKWHKEIKAWADGESVEIREINEWVWDLLDIDGYPPFSDEEYEFRIKPQPKEPQYLYAYLSKKSAVEFCIIDGHVDGYEYLGKIKLESDNGYD